MSPQSSAYLHEMGIDHFQLRHPERLAGYTPSELILPESCQLLLVSDHLPVSQTATLFENILKAMNLTLAQAAHIYPHQLASLGRHQLNWLWFAGCEPLSSLENTHVLTSESLTLLDGDNQRKRALWQQIRQYQSS
ncbi:DNA polymerase III subunit psi [Vibrio sp. AK197]